jgi:periplasmic copper chaperone A
MCCCRPAPRAAQNVEVHESYEHEDGMIGMREVRDLEIPAQSTVRFEQGGLHIMLIQLTRQLRDGDIFELTLSFENHGDVSFDILVRL